MADFTFDTSGTVDADAGRHIALDGQLYLGVGWGILPPFTQGYIEALFTENMEALNEARLAARLPLRRAAFRDLAPETLARIIADCERFLSLPRTDSAAVGRDCWNRRHGPFGYAGFPPLTVQLGDDGKVRFAQ